MNGSVMTLKEDNFKCLVAHSQLGMVWGLTLLKHCCTKARHYGNKV